jgi:hypothetical protein
LPPPSVFPKVLRMLGSGSSFSVMGSRSAAARWNLPTPWTQLHTWVPWAFFSLL